MTDDPTGGTRRAFMAGFFSAAVSAPLVAKSSPARATPAPVDLDWKDLRPRISRGYAPQGGGLSHRTIPARRFTDPRAFMVVRDYNGRQVRLPGFLIPLDLTARGATEFLLVPFVGACIHVPPPPPNQIVHAMSEEPYQMEGLFEPVYAVGTLDTVYADTELAQASYRLAVDRFEEVRL